MRSDRAGRTTMRRRRLVMAALMGVVGVWVGTSHADAPPGRYSISGDNVVDTKTGLTWQRTSSTSTYKWADAKSYCAGLGGAWRLPSIKELQTIVDRTRSNPSIDVTAFPNTPPSTSFWSSSPLAGNPSIAWYVSFGYGFTNRLDVTSTYRVRCVR